MYSDQTCFAKYWYVYTVYNFILTLHRCTCTVYVNWLHWHLHVRIYKHTAHTHCRRTACSKICLVASQTQVCTDCMHTDYTCTPLVRIHQWHWCGPQVKPVVSPPHVLSLSWSEECCQQALGHSARRGAGKSEDRQQITTCPHSHTPGSWFPGTSWIVNPSSASIASHQI